LLEMVRWKGINYSSKFRYVQVQYSTMKNIQSTGYIILIASYSKNSLLPRVSGVKNSVDGVTDATSVSRNGVVTVV
jgi:hypothetical protein